MRYSELYSGGLKSVYFGVGGYQSTYGHQNPPMCFCVHLQYIHVLDINILYIVY